MRDALRRARAAPAAAAAAYAVAVGAPDANGVRCTEVSKKIVALARRINARIKVVSARAAWPGRSVLPPLLIEHFRTPAGAARRRRLGGANLMMHFQVKMASIGRVPGGVCRRRARPRGFARARMRAALRKKPDVLKSRLLESAALHHFACGGWCQPGGGAGTTPSHPSQAHTLPNRTNERVSNAFVRSNHALSATPGPAPPTLVACTPSARALWRRHWHTPHRGVSG